MFGKIRINDPYNTMGSFGPSMNDPESKRVLKRLADAAKNAPDGESRKRIEAYRKSVEAAYKDFPGVIAGTNQAASSEPYRNLTRSDCALIWRPDCPEVNDPERRA
jgi:hypothetical protein